MGHFWRILSERVKGSDLCTKSTLWLTYPDIVSLTDFAPAILAFFLLIIHVCMCVESLSNVWLWNLMDCNPPGLSVHGISQARILEWGAISYSGGSFRDWTQVSCIPCIGWQILCPCTTWGAPLIKQIYKALASFRAFEIPLPFTSTCLLPSNVCFCWYPWSLYPTRNTSPLLVTLSVTSSCILLFCGVLFFLLCKIHENRDHIFLACWYAYNT